MRMLRDLALNMATNATISPSSSISSSSLANNNVMTKTAKNYNAWKSPIPYLFGSLAMMLLLITVALVLLVFSYRKSRGDRRDGDQKKLPKAAMEAVDVEPRVVVIMAGDDKPTYLATPSLTLAMPSANICSCHHNIINSSHDQDNNNNNN